MAHQKINHALILSAVLLLLLGCKKLSKEYTTARWEIINPVTNIPYGGIPVRLILADYRGSSPEYKTIWQGETNAQGIAEYKFKGFTNPSFGYLEQANLAVLGVGGIDYSIIRRPYAGGRSIDELNDLRYEIVPYANFVLYIKNLNCQGSDDKMRYRSNRLYTRPNDGFTNWSPSPTLTSGYYEGCYENISSELSNPSDSILYEIEVTKNGNKEVLYKTFFVGSGQVDTVKIYY